MNILAVDHGNFLIKTPNDAFSNGLDVSAAKSPLSEKCILYNGQYYLKAINPEPFLQDKTADDKLMVNTLYAYESELANGNINPAQPIYLAIGLPPFHDLEHLSKKYKEYFQKHSENGIVYELVDSNESKLRRTIQVKDIVVFPQAYAAIRAYQTYVRPNSKVVVKSSLLNDHEDFVAIDIGGYTAEVLVFVDNKPEIAQSFVVEYGTIRMADEILKKIMLGTGKQLPRHILNKYLLMKAKGKATVKLPEDVVRIIEQECGAWAHKLLNTVRTDVGDLTMMPVVFVGGGAMLLKRYLISSPLLGECEVIEDVCANAKGLRLLAKAVFKQKG